MTDPLSVLIIGCGNIAGGYDEAGDNKAIRSHAGAYINDDRFHISACIDPDENRLDEFMTRWKVPVGFPHLAACKAAGQSFDIASVCVPTAHHGAVLLELVNMPLRAVLAEKPLTGDITQSRQIVEAYAAACRPLAVNFLRRFDPVMATLRSELENGEWGRLQSASAYYAKGVINCGSHAIDLLQYFFGSLRPISVSEVINDYQLSDPTLPARLETWDGAPVQLVGCDSRMYFPFEIDLVMEKGRISLEDLGSRVRRRSVRPHPVFLNQSTLDDGVWMDTQLPITLANAVGEIYEHVTNAKPLVSDGVSALATEEVCAALLAMVGKKNEGGSR